MAGFPSASSSMFSYSSTYSTCSSNEPTTHHFFIAHESTVWLVWCTVKDSLYPPYQLIVHRHTLPTIYTGDKDTPYLPFTPVIKTHLTCHLLLTPCLPFKPVKRSTLPTIYARLQHGRVLFTTMRAIDSRNVETECWMAGSIVLKCICWGASRNLELAPQASWDTTQQHAKLRNKQ